MKVLSLETNPNLYSGNAYLLLGEWNTLDDINAVVDTGTDDYIIKSIEKTYTGVGKNPVDKIILTHNHFDHIGGAKFIKNKYNAKIYAKIQSNDLVDFIVKDGEKIKLAEHEFRIIHSPGHSTDSICLYCEKEQVLFTGDTCIHVRDTSGSYTVDYIRTMRILFQLKVKVIYPGHGAPINEGAEKILKESYLNILKSKIL